MKIIRSRTLKVTPWFSFEAEVEDKKSGEKYYINISVNDQGEQEEILEDSWWAYCKPLDEISGDDFDDAVVRDVDFSDVLKQMLERWNANPVFIGDGVWENW